jgi:hypothetical protein
MSPDLESAPLRRAALTVHALPQGDRAWMLASLSPADRESLSGLLAELDELGIPPDPSLLGGVPADSGKPEDESGQWPEALDDAGVSALQRVLAREPSSVTRALLSLRAWTWRTRLLAVLDTRTCAEVEAQPIVDTPGTHFSAALLKALGTQLDREPRAVPPTAGRWKPAWVRIGRRA